MQKIRVQPIAAESLGVRSLSTVLATPDCKILMDPSAAITSVKRLAPHPLEYQTLKRIINQLQDISSTIDILTISHFHQDHFRPTFTNYVNHWSSPQSTLDIYQDHTIYMKHPRETINASQRRRAYFLEKFAKKHGLNLCYMDNSSVQFNNTQIQFSPPFPHGVDGTPLGWIIATRVIYEDASVIFAPDVQGPIDKKIVDWILSTPPSILVIGGPPIYLPDHLFSTSQLDSAEKNFQILHENVPHILIDHHLLRSSNWENWISQIKSSSSANTQIQCFAEYLGIPVTPLEANRRSLYQNFPPSEKFLKWNSRRKKQVHVPPPLD
jgi:predicted metallo-beta-lactamase superfamily hydrolase